MWKSALSGAAFSLVPSYCAAALAAALHGLGVQEPRMEEATPRTIEISPGESETILPAEASRIDMTGVAVAVRPQTAARRRRAQWRGLSGEVAQFTGSAPFEYEFQGPVHLLTLVERGVRAAG